jgi:hypothetical protein
VFKHAASLAERNLPEIDCVSSHLRGIRDH